MSQTIGSLPHEADWQSQEFSVTRTPRGRNDSRAEPGGPVTRADEQLAGGLGWFSIGLGLAEILAPRAIAELIGIEEHTATLRAMGAREVATGLGILSERRPSGWLQARVAGDVMDLSLLATAMRSPHTQRDKTIWAAAAVAGVMVLDLIAAQRLARSTGDDLLPAHSGAATRRPMRGVHVTRAVTIYKPIEEVYQFWRNFENLPKFMQHLESVRVHDDGKSHWVAKAPFGTSVEWDAEIVEDRPDEFIAWKSLAGSDVDNAGSVRFINAPGHRGTEVHVELRFDPPGGAIGATIARLFGEEPHWQVADDLRHLRQLMETGELPTTQGQPSGR